jgi:hypothetical protein
MFRPLRTSLFLACLLSVTSANAQAPLLGSTERARAKQMLGDIKAALKNDYYDKTFHGIDITQHFKDAEAKLD